MNEQEIQTIIDTVRSGDEQAFNAFYKYFYPRLYSKFLPKIKSPQNTEDIISEAIYKFYKRFAIDGKKPLPKNSEAFLTIITKNLFIDFVKKENKQTALDDIQAGRLQADDYFETKDKNQQEQQKDVAMKQAWQKLSEMCQNLLTDAKFKHKTSRDEMLQKYAYKNRNTMDAKIAQCWKKFKILARDFYKQSMERGE